MDCQQRSLRTIRRWRRNGNRVTSRGLAPDKPDVRAPPRQNGVYRRRSLIGEGGFRRNRRFPGKRKPQPSLPLGAPSGAGDRRVEQTTGCSPIQHSPRLTASQPLSASCSDDCGGWLPIRCRGSTRTAAGRFRLGTERRWAVNTYFDVGLDRPASCWKRRQEGRWVIYHRHQVVGFASKAPAVAGDRVGLQSRLFRASYRARHTVARADINNHLTSSALLKIASELFPHPRTEPLMFFHRPARPYSSLWTTP